MKRALLLMLALSVFGTGCAHDVDLVLEPPCTGNLVNRDSDVWHIHDPAIAKENGSYYIYSSSPLGSFYRSEDMRTWIEAGRLFDALPDWTYQALVTPDHIGAPDIARVGDQWVLYYQSHIGGTCNAGTGVATNITLDPDSPDYHWVDHGLVLRSTPLFDGIDIICGQDEAFYNAIDPHLFIDVDDRPWLAFGSTIGGLLLAEIDPVTFRPTQHPRDFVTLAARDLLQPGPIPIIEAPYLINREGWYYLFLSHNSCCQGADTKYKILVGRSRNLKGPYVDREGVSLLEDGGTVLIEREGTMIGTGHADVYSENGFDYLVHHAYDSERDYESILNIRRMDWDDEGWPSACQATPEDY